MYRNLNAKALGVTGHQSEIIELALTYGFRGMDVDIAEMTRRAQKHGSPYAKRLIASAKIRVGSFALPFDWDVDDAAFKSCLEKLPEYADMAKGIGCTRCLATVAPAGDKRPYHENFEYHRHRLGGICKAFEPYGVWLGIGFRAPEALRKGQAFQFVHDLEALMLLVNMVGSANLGIVLDVWDLHVSGGSVENMQSLPPEKILAVQLADLPDGISLEEATDRDRLLPGATGRIDIPDILAALSTMGYDGPVTAKPAKTTLDATRRDPIVREVAEAMDRMWRTAGLSAEGRKLPVTAER